MTVLSNTENALVLMLDSEALIQTVRHNSFERLEFNENTHVSNYLVEDSIPVFMEHIQNAVDNDCSLQGVVDFKDGDTFVRVYMTLIRYDAGFIAVFNDQDSATSNILSELININNAQTNLIRRVHALANQENTPLDEVYMQELTNLNSDLVNAQRALEQRNSELRRLNEKLRVISMIDDLTGMYNRRKFFEDFNDLTPPLTLIMTDFNNFKHVNDELGHAAGDSVLKTFGESLQESLKKCGGKIYRIGGDEFSILIPSDETLSLEEIFQSIEETLKSFHSDLSLAYGTATLSKGETVSLNALMRKADKRMYNHKYTKKSLRK